MAGAAAAAGAAKAIVKNGEQMLSRLANNKFTKGMGRTLDLTSLGQQAGRTALGYGLSWAFNQVAFSFTALWGWCVGAFQLIWNFNWNISDKGIEELQKSVDEASWEIAGETIGATLGWMAGGAIPGTMLKVINEPMAVYARKNLKEEMKDELGAEFSGNLKTLRDLQTRKYFYEMFKNARNWLKNNPNHPMSRYIQQMTGLDAQKLQSWGGGDAQPFTFAGQMERKIATIPDSNIAEAVREGLDSFADSFIEAGYVIANSVDSWYAQNAMNKGPSRNIAKIYPDKSIEDEYYAIPSNYIDVTPQILSNHQLIGTRDVGIVTGLDELTLTRLVQPSDLIIQITWYNRPAPPYSTEQVQKDKRSGKPNGETLIKKQVTICDVNRAKLDWYNIKRAAGGIYGYPTGEILCTARLESGRKIKMYGSTYQEAQEMVENLARLTDKKILYPLSFVERREFKKSKAKLERFPTVRMYPAYFTIIAGNSILPNSKDTLNQNRGTKTKHGEYLKRRAKVFMYMNQPPADWKKIKQALFTISEEERNKLI